MSAKPSRALVVKLSSLGDLFHALPAVHQLKQAKDLTIDWVTQPEYAELVACFDDVDRVITFPRRQFIRSLSSFLHQLREYEYRYVFDFQGLLKSALTAKLARSAHRIGPSFQREGARWFYDEVAGERDKYRHAVEESFDFVRHFGLTPKPATFPVRFPHTFLPGKVSAPRIGYLPCSRWATKNWPPEHFVRLINSLHAEIGGTALLLGSPGDRPTCDAMAAAITVPCTNLCGETGLLELGSYLQQLDLLITVDSGPMHMAAAVGTPVLAVFGATEALRTGPYGRGHRVVAHGGLTCQPCRSRHCQRPQRDLACLTQLHPDRVFDAAIAMLAERPRQSEKDVFENNS
jgi:ADP-heptose:LPS heptosyltransferase